MENMSVSKLGDDLMEKCEFCGGKGYTQLQSFADEPHSREDCPYCYGGKKREEDL